MKLQLFSRKNKTSEEQLRSAYTAGHKRGFDAGRINRLTASFNANLISMDNLLRMDLKVLKARCRNLLINNDYARRFISLLRINVVGPKGFMLQNKAKDPSGKLDVIANTIIEENWAEWSRKEYASASGKLSFFGLCQLFVDCLGGEGEVLFRRIKGADNPFGYTIKPLETDLLDIDLNKKFSNGNEIRMGIEFTPDDKPVRYYLKRKEYLETFQGGTHEVLTPDEIIHVFIQERPFQSRGIPPMCSAMIAMHNIHAAEEAEIFAVRGAASKMGFFKKPVDVDSTLEGEKDDGGNLIMEADPGHFDILPEGWDFIEYNPTHPNGNFVEFKKECLRSMSAGLGPANHSFTGDLESVNYSSARIGSIDERDFYRLLQRLVIEEFCIPVFRDLLDMSILKGKVKLPYSKFDKFNKPVFYPRAWSWVDPEKDVNASILAIKNRLISRTEIIAEQGRDIRTVFEQIAEEEKLAKELGISLEVIDAKLNPKQEDNNGKGTTNQTGA